MYDTASTFAAEFVRAVLCQFTATQRRRALDTPNIVLQPEYSRRINALFDTMVAESLMNRKSLGRIPVAAGSIGRDDSHRLKVVG